MKDDFNGDNAKLVSAIEALLALDASGSLVPHGVGGHARTMLEAAAVRLSASKPAVTTVFDHSDDFAIDHFAVALKAKLAASRAKGRGGWEQCDPAMLSNMLREHVEKGDPRDVANFCMFLWWHKASIAACPAAPAQSGEPVIPPFVTEQHTADFQRLYSLLEDGEGYDIPKDRMESLADTGLIRNERAAKTKCTQCCGLGYYRGKWPFDWSVTCEICQGKGQVRAASPQATLQDAAVSVVQAIAATKQLSNLVEAQATATQPAQTERALTAARPAIGETE